MSSGNFRVGIYARVSTEQQTVLNQLLDLRRYADARGWEVVAEHTDVGVSGVKGRRPGLDKLMDDARKRRLDGVLVWRFDRFARSVRHLVEALDEFNSLGVHFTSYMESIDTTSPMGRLVVTLLGAVGETERQLTIERIHAGLRRARREGKRLGRPRADISRARVRRLSAEGFSIRQIAAKLGASPATVHQLLRRENDLSQNRVD